MDRPSEEWQEAAVPELTIVATEAWDAAQEAWPVRKPPVEEETE